MQSERWYMTDIGNTGLRNELIYPASFLSVCNSKPLHKVFSTTVNSGVAEQIFF